MIKEQLIKDFEIKQYFDQSNLVYISAFISYILLVPFFYFTAGLHMAMIYLACMLMTFVSLYLNRKKHYAYATLVFILAMNFSVVISLFAFGRSAGFYYYFFNLSVLIVFSNWKSQLKLVSILFEVLLFIFIHFMSYRISPFLDMSSNYLMLLHTINIVFNIAGVANSSYYYVNIAKDYQEDILKMASTDYLTGLPNRSSFTKFYDQVQDDCKKGLGIYMMDLDHFKRINDTYGHMCGDYVLKECARIILEEVKHGDMFARYGGEEFVFVHEVQNKDEVMNKAELLRSKIEKQNLSFDNHTFSITISIGAIYRKPSDDICSRNVLQLADKLLYESKDKGRNIVTFKEI